MAETNDLPHIGPAEPAGGSPTSTLTPVNDEQHFTAKPFAPLVGFLDIGESELTNKTQTALNELWEYLGKESKSELTSERLYALRSLENRLSPPRLGQSRLNVVHNYILAQAEVSRAEEMRNSHLRSIDGRP